MEGPEINFSLLGSEENFVEIMNTDQESLLDRMLSKLYANEEKYNQGQNDRALLAKWKTNARYQISEVPAMPIFGYKQVDFILGNPVFLFSKQYSDPEEFIEAFCGIIWVTYRFGFDPIIYKEKIFTSDTGWGCTIRVGQMLLMNTLKMHFNTTSCVSLLELIQENLTAAPFSLHKIVECGENLDKHPGDWYSPSLISHVLQRLTEAFTVPNFSIQVFMDSIIYKSQISTKKSTLMLVPLMLGIGSIQEEYFETLQFLLGLQWSVGIIGGIPKSALYIVGFQGNELLFLDPHLVQPACTSGQDLINKLNTYQCSSPKLLPLTSAESSISVGMYFRSFSDFKEFEAKVAENERILHGVISIKDFDEKAWENQSESEEEYYLV